MSLARRRGVSANDGGAGFLASAFLGQAATNLMVIRSLAFNNATSGVVADGASATIQVGQSTISGNAFSWPTVNGGTLQSFGDNNVAGNADGDPAAPSGTIAKKSPLRFCRPADHGQAAPLVWSG
jgi:hypothetical protein